MSKPMESIVVSRLVRAPLDQVWRVWTEGPKFAKWLAPHADTVARAVAFDAASGGAWHVEMRDPDGRTWSGRGRFVVVQPKTRLAFTWEWAHRTGEALVEATFETQGDATRVTVTESRLTDAKQRREDEAGWIECLERLARAAA